mgnify:FL=1|jgi:arylsulfatase A-like enzyme
MNKLNPVLLITVAAALVACSDSTELPVELDTSNNGAPTHPNVVFILADDMGFGDVGYNGSEIATPNLDQMAQAGMKLDRNYVYPICSPTRAALLTGQNPLHHGVDGPMADDTGLPLDLKIMPQYFKDLGYQTHMIGKWHLGIGNTDYWPRSRGFDTHYGFLGGWVDFYTHVYSGGLDWQREGRSLREEGHTTDLLTEEAIKIIQSKDSDNPFFLYLTYNAPHSPLQNIPTQTGLNEGLEAGHRFVYGEMVTQLDDGIGRVVDALEAGGILDNTIVVFSSDNGGSLGLGANNGDLRGGKGGAYEGGMRVPGLISWPSHIEAGRVLEQPIAVHDWLPTLLDAVGGDSSQVDRPYGQSMWPAISEGIEMDRARMIIGARENMAVFDWPWKLVREGEEAEYQLFNLLADPVEQEDLAVREPEILATLVTVLEAKPVVASKRDTANGSANSYYASGADTDYDARLQESRPPWAEQAVRGGEH